MNPLIENYHAAGFMVSEANGHLSREQIVLTGGAVVQAGTVLGKVLNGAVTSAAAAGNIGNGLMSGVAAGAAPRPGIYRVVLIEPAANAGEWSVEDPEGVTVGTVATGVAYNGPVAFTIADGATDFAAGDSFNVTVAAGSAKYKPCNPTANDGSQIAAGILWEAKDATGADVQATAIVRHAEVNKSELLFDASFDTDLKKAAALAQLATRSVVAR